MDIEKVITERMSVRDYEDTPVDRALIDKIISLAHSAPSSCNLQLTEYVVVTDKALKDKLAKEITGKFNWAPVYIVLCYDSKLTVKRQAAVTSLGASMQNILLAAKANGLGACPMAGFGKDEKLKSILSIPKHYNVGLLISLGYPDQKAQQKKIPKTKHEQVLHWNVFTKENQLKHSINVKSWSTPELVAYRERIAPVYFYQNRFNLHPFLLSVFEGVETFFDQQIEQSTRILDLVSYDCTFAKAMIEKNSEAQITVSDFFEYPIKTFAFHYENAKGALIDQNYKTDLEQKSYDFISIIHKLHFVPKPKKILTHANELLARNGYLAISLMQEKPLKRFLRAIQRSHKRLLKKEVFNVYENNPFYKIGPYQHISAKKLNAWAAKLGLKKVKEQTLNRDGQTAYMALYKKNDA